MLRSLIALSVTFCLSLAMGGCNKSDSAKPADSSSSSGSSSTTPAPASKGTIGVSLLTLSNPFFKVIGDTIAADAAKQGYDTIVVSGDFDVARQQNQVKDFIVRHCAAIVLCPCDSRAIGPAIKEANDAHIPVFTADIATLAEGVKVVCHIATDNYSGGKQAGAAMIEALGEAGGKIVILDFKQAESCLLRVKGFKEVIEAYNAGRSSGKIEIVAELNGGGKSDQGYKAAEDALQSQPELAGIFAINDPSALGARAAMEKANKADRIVLIGFDGQPDGKQAIKEGKIYADPIQFPDRIGAITVQTIIKYFNGETVAPNQLIGTELYRKADALKDPTVK